MAGRGIRTSAKSSTVQSLKRELVKKDAAIDELLHKYSSLRHDLEAVIRDNLVQVIHPLLARLELTVPKQGRVLLDMLRQAIDNLAHDYGARSRKDLSSLSRKEIEVSNMIRYGLTSKEMAQLMKVSPQTVETHRKNIRRKLGLRGKDTNLSTYLSKP
ncbi:MAG: helix-turn-helix transcriptional regulator [Deltaproteobacteria bacterium]|nr:helix-turn-helix transcriptional regulator [Deltaproteobacteria bacterium]